MKKIESIEEFDSFISSEKPVIVVFSTHDCATCKPVKEKVEKRFTQVETAEVFLDDLTELSGRLSIFNVPTVCIYLESKELYRFIRVFSMDEIEEKLNRILQFME
ncbi:thioredoxin family protein [Hippea alviniae]|uniref:thioredoxin family protein n=1 Tax=Hippea alviniae TaxID=1279027 RepID=UPI0003B7AD0C|nr:thioredoxin family protein [Hippea alviniae]